MEIIVHIHIVFVMSRDATGGHARWEARTRSVRGPITGFVNGVQD